MSKTVVHIVGTGTIGEPLIGMLIDFKDELGIDEVTFHKNTPLRGDRSKVVDLLRRGARLAVNKDTKNGFLELGITPTYESIEAIDNATVVIDCTPRGIGHKNKTDYYSKFTHNTKGFIAQGSEFGFGKPYARGVNDEALKSGEDQFIQVVSCNTHNISSLINTIAYADKDYDNLSEGRFVCIRRANDISQESNFIPAPEVGIHSDDDYGTHHARDAATLFKTLGVEPNIFSSAMKINSQYMHVLYFNIKVKEDLTIDKVYERLSANPLAAMTYKLSSSTVFSFGRDHGHYGRILNETVIAKPTLHVKDGHEVIGYSFTPQDGNSLLSSISAALWLIDPETHNGRLQSLKDLFFTEV
ncbi:MAG: hypothetical protein IH795_09305 [Bacteroidetes bacterium]|nr:hypothetical protein [Bacteroidota bacterium]